MRHGRTENNVRHIAQGHLDSELDEVGLHQAGLLANFFQSARLQGRDSFEIWSSDLKRSIQTAEPTVVRLGVPMQTTSLLRERRLGQLEGVSVIRLRREFDAEVERTGESRYRVKPLGCESAYEVMERADQVHQRIEETQKSLIIFTHGMMKEVLLCRMIGAPVESSRSFRFDNASITELRFQKNVWVLERFNHRVEIEKDFEVPLDE